VLGSGVNGNVYLALGIQNNEKYAVKDFNFRSMPKEQLNELEAEVEIFLGMDHPHVARLVDVYAEAHKLSLIAECMTGGELFDRISARKRFAEADAIEACYQMLVAINYMHSHNIVHRDIKLENFLYERPDSDHLKLIDFGFSRNFQPNTKMAASLGTLAYIAPEVLNGSYTSKCDLWSLGVTVFILLFGQMPFSGSERNMCQAISRAQYKVKPESWNSVSSTAQDFIKKLIIASPSDRLDAEGALAHPWIAERLTAPNPSAIDSSVAEALVSFGRASTLKRACMSMVAWSMTNEDRAKVRDAFLAMDTDRSGTVTFNEFEKVAKEQFSFSDDETRKAFQALDTTHDDEIHYSDFLAGMVCSRVQFHEELLRDTFRRFDVDNSGYIDAGEMKQILGETYDGFDTEKLMQEAGVMEGNQISYEDWMRLLHKDESHHDIADGMIQRVASVRISPTKLDIPGPVPEVSAPATEPVSAVSAPATET